MVLTARSLTEGALAADAWDAEVQSVYPPPGNWVQAEHYATNTPAEHYATTSPAART
jgi:hypothetical protein